MLTDVEQVEVVRRPEAGPDGWADLPTRDPADLLHLALAGLVKGPDPFAARP
jgi:hypothetical protein